MCSSTIATLHFSDLRHPSRSWVISECHSIDGFILDVFECFTLLTLHSGVEQSHQPRQSSDLRSEWEISFHTDFVLIGSFDLLDRWCRILSATRHFRSKSIVGCVDGGRDQTSSLGDHLFKCHVSSVSRPFGGLLHRDLHEMSTEKIRPHEWRTRTKVFVEEHLCGADAAGGPDGDRGDDLRGCESESGEKLVGRVHPINQSGSLSERDLHSFRTSSRAIRSARSLLNTE